MYLSYSGFKCYQSCELQYWHKYIAKTTVDQPDNRCNMLYGTAVGALFEAFYNEKLWMKPEPKDLMLALVDSTIDRIVAEETRKGGVFNWADPKLKKGTRSLEDVKAEVLDTIPRGINIIRKHRLLGPKAGAEVKLDNDIGGHRLAGRADFIMRRMAPYGDRIILDGKGSRYRDEYVDVAQLRWYAMLHEKMFGFLPDRLGFVYWRSEPEKAVDWVDCKAEDVAQLKGTALRVIASIEDGKRHLPVLSSAREQLHEVFPAKPSKKNCAWCNYAPICPAGLAMQTKNVPIPNGVGVEDVGF